MRYTGVHIYMRVATEHDTESQASMNRILYDDINTEYKILFMIQYLI